MRTRYRTLAVGLGALAMGITGCRGNSSEGHFDVRPVVDVALHGRVPFSIRPAEGEDRVMLTEVEASVADAVRVEGTENDGEMSVRGIRVANGVEISFVGTSGGARKNDSFSFDVLEVESLKLPGECEDGVYFRGRRARISYDLEARDARSVEGLDLYPFDVFPADSLVLEKELSTLESFLFEVSTEAPAEVRIESTFARDRGNPDSARTLRIVDETVVHLRTKPGETGKRYGTYDLDLRVLGEDDLPVCSAFHKRVISSSPSICAFTEKKLGVFDTREDFVAIEFVGHGSCSIRVEFPEVGLEIPAWTIQVENDELPIPGGGDDWD